MRLGDQFCVRFGDRAPDLENASWAIWVLDRNEIRHLSKRSRHRRTRRGPGGFKTAITRQKRRASPLRKVSVNGCGRGLYHGMGRDEPGLEWLKRVCVSAVGYDPYSPKKNRRRRPTGLFDLVVSSYTLNVVDTSEGRQILSEISRRMSPRGRAVIAVRRDVC